MEVDITHMYKAKSLWVFGYGSLMWKPEFAHDFKQIGHINGFVRRFWQGSTTHRGTKDKPGRVATLVEDNKEILWGVGYRVSGREEIKRVLENLFNRESKLGGYKTVLTRFYPRDRHLQPVDILVFTATSYNERYLGPMNLNIMANEIVKTRGFAGSNTEYVTKTADFVRDFIPEEQDTHLFELDKTIKHILNNDDRKHMLNVYKNVEHLHVDSINNFIKKYS